MGARVRGPVATRSPEVRPAVHGRASPLPGMLSRRRGFSFWCRNLQIPPGVATPGTTAAAAINPAGPAAYPPPCGVRAVGGLRVSFGRWEVRYFPAGELLRADESVMNFDKLEDRALAGHPRMRRVLLRVTSRSPLYVYYLHWSDGTDLEVLANWWSPGWRRRMSSPVRCSERRCCWPPESASALRLRRWVSLRWRCSPTRRCDGSRMGSRRHARYVVSRGSPASWSSSTWRRAGPHSGGSEV